MNNEITETEKLGKKYLSQVEATKTEEHTWVDKAHVMYVRTNRSELVNVLRNYEEREMNSSTLLGIRNLQTVEAKFSLEYFTDILKVLMKAKSKGESPDIKIVLGKDTPITLSVEKSDGTMVEMILAPRIHD